MTHFTGQKLIVIGGSSGMGRQTAIDIVEHGGSAVIVGRKQATVDETVAELSKNGSAWGITADLANRDEIPKVQAQLGQHADATLLVNAAGFFIPKNYLDYSADDYDSYLELNRAMFLLTQTVVRNMIAGGRGGAIVNVGSMWAHQAIASLPATGYSMAKAGMHAFTHNLAMELAPHQSVSTPSHRGSSPLPSTKASSRKIRSSRHCTASIPSNHSAGSAPPVTSPTPSSTCCPTAPTG